MGRLLDENDVYALFAKNGTARLHVADIDALPRVNAVEVVHGRWIRKQIGKYPGADEVCCSICGDFVGVVCSDTAFEEAKTGLNYCSNCGAKMDLEGKE